MLYENFYYNVFTRRSAGNIWSSICIQDIVLHSFLSSSPRQIWTDLQKLLVEFSTFVKLGKCGLIRTQ